jgi:type I restriction enzyme S subunit
MEVVFLNEICSPKQWKTISSNKLLETGYPIYGANGIIGYYSEYTHENPTILITCRGATCGTINISKPKSYVNGNAMALDKLSQKVDLNYLKYILIARGLDDVISGSAQPQITRTNLNKIKIPLPPLKTQQRVGNILDNAAALRDKTAQLIKEYDLLAQSIFLEMFGDPVSNTKGWKVNNIGNICKKIQIGPFGSQLHQSDYQDLGFSLVNPTDINEGKIKLEGCRKIDEDKFNSLPNYHLEKGDVIIARRGDLSKIAVIRDENLFCGTGSFYIRFNENINPIFSLYYFTHTTIISKLYEKARGITMANLNKSIIKGFDITIPPINIQNQFAEKIALIEEQKKLAKQELQESKDLFNCLLQKAFKGELK